jgi:hypothetical protein
LSRLALGVLLRVEHDGMPLRFLENHLSDVEQRIRPARHLNLARQGFNAPFFGTQAEVNIRQRRRRWAPVAGVTGAKTRSRAAERLAALAFGPWRAAPRSGWAATIAARAIVVSSRTAGAVTARRTGTTSIAVTAAVEPLGFAFVFGVLGGRRLLRPGGQEEFV